jgi:hypothetical protein
MSNSQNPAAILAALLSGLSNGNVRVVDLELDPSRSFDEQFGEIEARIAAAEKEAAEHREVCSTCRELYEATQKRAAAAQADEDRVDERAAGFNPAPNAAYGIGDFNAELMKKAVEGASLKGADTKPVFHEIGFMAFLRGKPILQSFRTDRADVEKAYHAFVNDPTVVLINGMMGIDVRVEAKYIEIRPVYDKR